MARVIFVNRFCECGCGEFIGEWKHRSDRNPPRYKHGHNLNRRSRPDKWLSPKGYVIRYRPNSEGGPIFEHRFIMEQHIGRKLLVNEDVHHKNGIKTDNRIENLEIIDHQEHSLIHAKDRGRKLRVLSDDDVKKIAELRKEGKSYNQLARIFQVAPMTIYRWFKIYEKSVVYK